MPCQLLSLHQCRANTARAPVVQDLGPRQTHRVVRLQELGAQLQAHQVRKSGSMAIVVLICTRTASSAIALSCYWSGSCICI
jgi:hypothetical protein